MYIYIYVHLYVYINVYTNRKSLEVNQQWKKTQLQRTPATRPYSGLGFKGSRVRVEGLGFGGLGLRVEGLGV